jgi:hypothetical protein
MDSAQDRRFDSQRTGVLTKKNPGAWMLPGFFWKRGVA